ncbi:MAG: sulfur carrier protein ThiS [Deltaproteobacteria bacterium]|jgi:sulfur carrier protein|nr:sulfur carrier protein ThiS [Deltaproteobacteria bacterium]MBW2531672.1 sulfur carrier protein ThiS [Deltaproteobacteria bacterium]
MILRVNGRVLETEAPTTVRQLLEKLGFDRGPVAVERNGELVPRVDHGGVELGDGDVVEIIELSGGG